MKRKHRNRLFVLTGIVLLGLILYFEPFSRTEITVLNHLTEMDSDGVVSQICLVKNPPSLSSTLESEIVEFDNANPVKGKYFRRLFIKEHDNGWFPGLFLQENVDYESTNITRYDIDNIDFLADSDYILTNDGEVFKKISLQTGELWYYKY